MAEESAVLEEIVVTGIRGSLYSAQAMKENADTVVDGITADDIGAALAPVVGLSARDILVIVDEIAAETAMVPVVNLRPCLSGLAGHCPLGVVTNDSEIPASRHLEQAGVRDFFGFLSGFDSGHGVKPAPGPLLAGAVALGAEPQRTVMVGDSVADLAAGRAAGMRNVAVLTGVAGEADLAPLADVVLPDIGHLEDWLRRA